MKVICIENKCVDGQLHPFLTINETYDVNIEDNLYINIEIINLIKLV